MKKKQKEMTMTFKDAYQYTEGIHLAPGNTLVIINASKDMFVHIDRVWMEKKE